MVESSKCIVGEQIYCVRSNLLSMDSSHDSLYENAVNKAKFSGAPEAVVVSHLPDRTFGEVHHSSIPIPKNYMLKRYSQNLDDSRGLEAHDDNISCLSSLTSKDVVEDSCFQHQLEPSSSTVMTKKEVCHVHKSAPCVCEADSLKNSKMLEAGANIVANYLPEEALNSVNQSEEVARAGESFCIPNVKEASSLSEHMEEDDESDLVEQDVKVCDICGDAGREDLLAICCRCSDGAEHTYCMREFLQKVPEGDWLCEECKLDDELKNQKQNKFETEGGFEKGQSSCDAETKVATVHVKHGSNVSSDVKRKRTSKGLFVDVSRKRHADELEVSTAAKKQALEPIPKNSNPGRLHSLTRDSSSKDLDNWKVKDTELTNDSGTRLQAPRGALFKSNSFNVSDAKSKVKRVDEVVLQKQKSIKEPVSRYSKEGSIKEMGKSMSFKSTNSSRLGVESKVKMLSPKFSYVKDIKGLRHASERNSTFRSPRSSASSPLSLPNVDKTLRSHGESASNFSTSDRESKATQSDGKSIEVSKLSNRLDHRGKEVFNASGEANRQLYKSVDQKPVQSVLNDDSLSNLATAEDEVSQPIEVPYQKSKEIRHSAQCTPDTPQSVELDVPAPNSSREVINKGNKLKAAIEAAILKKPGIYRRNRMPDQPGGLSVSKSNHIVRSQDPLLSKTRNVPSAEQATDGEEKTLQDSNASPYRNGDGSSMFSSDGKHCKMELLSYDSAAFASLLKMSSIPDYKYSWQGSFEVHRSGKPPHFWDGFQAHLSTCASPKVFEAVNKFPSRVLLSEVPRASSWPRQFEEHGVKEDNIALYFFATDLESYDRSYKNLLDDMMRGDLALKGIIDGVELLIFPSNHLPEKSQRWNMLIFLWAVFRVKVENHFQEFPGSPKKILTPFVKHAASKSLLEHGCSLGSINNSAVHECANHVGAEAPPLIGCPPFTNHLSSIDTSDVQSTPGTRCVHPMEGLDSGCAVDGQQLSSCKRVLQDPAVAESLVSLRSASKENLLLENGMISSKDVEMCSKNLNVEKESVNVEAELEGAGILGIQSTTGLSSNSMECNIRKTKSIALCGNAAEDAFVGTKAIELLDSNRSTLVNEASASLNKQTMSECGSNIKKTTDSSGDGFAAIEEVRRSAEAARLLTARKDGERYFFPVEPPRQVKDDILLGEKPTPWTGSSSTNYIVEERFLDRVPNLELALGAELKQSKQDVQRGYATVENLPPVEEEDESASLSLSLSFPFHDKGRSTTNTEQQQNMTGKRQINQSVLLFGGVSDK